MRHHHGNRYGGQSQENTGWDSLRGSADRKRYLYRSRRGIILGVFRGLADYFGVRVFWLRLIGVIALFFTGFWPMVGLYLLAALLLKPAPVVTFKDESDREFYHTYTDSRSMGIQRLKRTFDQLDRRLRRLEDRVTDKEFDWDRRLRQGPTK